MVRFLATAGTVKPPQAITQPAAATAAAAKEDTLRGNVCDVRVRDRAITKSPLKRGTAVIPLLVFLS